MIESFQVEWGTGLMLTTVDTGLCPIFSYLSPLIGAQRQIVQR